MVQFYDHITESLRGWILKQKLFWVATAPLTAEGHVNLSTKGGYGTFHIIDENTVWYEDLTGSGVETIAHIRENGRITVLFNAFEGPPRILRLFGKGTVHEFGSPEYNALLPENARTPGSRSVIMINVYKVSTSCGYAVPFFDYRAERSRHHEMSVSVEAVDIASGCPSEPAKGGLKEYWQKQNIKSLDGLPGVLSAFQSTRQFVGVETPTNRPNRPRATAESTISSKVERFKPTSQTLLVTSLAFVAGVTLSARVYNTIERLGLFTL
ncbi:hypothetical protein APHAL10511_005210 [Amanita phalloides]|nr:hypothetical protein APHAL10511_005210 [Amanita phalloides]